MKKDEIISRFSQMSEDELNEMLAVYRKHKPRKANGKQVITIPDYLKSSGPFTRDDGLHKIVNSLPTCLTPMEAPSKALIEKCKKIYIDNCFFFDDIGELFVQKVLEYASSYQTKPLILHGSPGSGKSHRARVLAQMMSLPYYCFAKRRYSKIACNKYC